VDISKRKSINKNKGLEKFADLINYRNSSKYTEREKAVFNYVEEMTNHIVVSDEIYND